MSKTQMSKMGGYCLCSLLALQDQFCLIFWVERGSKEDSKGTACTWDKSKGSNIAWKPSTKYDIDRMSVEKCTDELFPKTCYQSHPHLMNLWLSVCRITLQGQVYTELQCTLNLMFMNIFINWGCCPHSWL